MDVLTTRRRINPALEKDLENSIVEQTRHTAMLEYIAICDHPEILEDEEGAET